MVSSDAQLLTVRLDVLRDIMIELAAALPRDCASRLVNAALKYAPYLDSGRTGAGNGIGRMFVMRQPAAVFVSV